MRRLTPALLLVVLALVAACGGGVHIASVTNSQTITNIAPPTGMPGRPVTLAEGGTYWIITATQLASFATKDYLLVMVEDDTIYIGEISGTDLFIQADNLSHELDKFPADKTTKIVVTCTRGMSSPIVAAALVRNGYTRVMELAGGIIGWYYQAYPFYDRHEGQTW
jgi:hypothetical protein